MKPIQTSREGATGDCACKRRTSNSTPPMEVTLVLRTTTLEHRDGGTWAIGTIAGHRFEAKVFPDPATNREWEVGGDSRISKLSLHRTSDGMTVYNWDRGPDIEPTTEMADFIVGLLAAGLADTIYAKLEEDAHEAYSDIP